MADIGTAVASAWQATLDFIKWAGPALKSGVLVAVGRLWQALVESAEDSKAIADQFKEIHDADQANADRPVTGAADRLRNSAWTRQRNPPS